MAEHLQAVKTIWYFRYERNTFTYAQVIEDANQIPVFLRDLQKSGVETVTMKERRTCGALPGLMYEESSEIDLTDVIIKAQ